jgi:enoyl-CoA hydratase/carnithine racemase
VTVAVERRGRVAVLMLDRPDALNALSPEMLDAIEGHPDTIERGQELRREGPPELTGR